jgi:hypothetical protein
VAGRPVIFARRLPLFRILAGRGNEPDQAGATQRHRLPFEGSAHEGSDGSSKCIFDLMQPERRAMLDFVTGQKFSDFTQLTAGSRRLSVGF